MATTTPNMSLAIPATGDAATSYVASVATSLTNVDAHDHSSGKGVPIRAQTLSWTATVDANAQAMQNLATTRYTSQAAALAPASFPRALYSVNGDLWWNSGTASLQLTSGAALNGTALGGFGGAYTTLGAQASYQNASGYTFNTPSLTLAQVNVGSLGATALTITNASASTAVTLSPAVTKTYRIDPIRGFTPTAQPPTWTGFQRIACPVGSASIRWVVPLPMPNTGSVTAVRARMYCVANANAISGTVQLWAGTDSSAAAAPTSQAVQSMPGGTTGSFTITLTPGTAVACAGQHAYVDFALTSPTSGPSIVICGVEMDVTVTSLPDTLA